MVNDYKTEKSMSSHKPTANPVRKYQKKIRKLEERDSLTDAQIHLLESYYAELRKLRWKPPVKKSVRHQTDDEVLSRAMALNDKARRGVNCKKGMTAKTGDPKAKRKSIHTMRSEKVFDEHLNEMFQAGEKQYLVEKAEEFYNGLEDDEKSRVTLNEIYTMMRHSLM